MFHLQVHPCINFGDPHPTLEGQLLEYATRFFNPLWRRSYQTNYIKESAEGGSTECFRNKWLNLVMGYLVAADRGRVHELQETKMILDELLDKPMK